MPAARTDLDHIVPFNHSTPETGGLTIPENLQALCRHHHILKTTGGWTVRRSATAMTTTWISPTGRQYANAA
jgi:5-methylcytosine-specific restriction endonuclease McrA